MRDDITHNFHLLPVQTTHLFHDAVVTWNRFPHCSPFLMGIHQTPHTGQRYFFYYYEHWDGTCKWNPFPGHAGRKESYIIYSTKQETTVAKHGIDLFILEYSDLSSKREGIETFVQWDLTYYIKGWEVICVWVFICVFACTWVSKIFNAGNLHKRIYNFCSWELNRQAAIPVFQRN